MLKSVALSSLLRSRTWMVAWVVLMVAVSCAEGIPEDESLTARVSTVITIQDSPLAALVTPTATSLGRTSTPTAALPSPETAPDAASPTSEPIPTEEAVEPPHQSLAWDSWVWQPDTDIYRKIPVYVGAHPWSPDGNSLVGWDQERKSLVTFELGRGTISLVGNTSAAAGSGDWSPVGRHLLYTIPDGPAVHYNIVVYDLVTYQETVVEENVPLFSIAGWSYDGSEVAYVSWEEEGDERRTVLEIVNVVSGTRHQLTDPSIALTEASWSPDSAQIAVYVPPMLPPYPAAGEFYCFAAVYLVDVHTGVFESLLNPADNDCRYFIHSSPWSNDGENIIYSDNGRICYTVVSTREETCFTELAERIEQSGSIGGRYPSWSSDGEWISFILQFENQYCNPIAIARTDGRGLRFTDAESGKCAVFGPIWEPME